MFDYAIDNRRGLAVFLFSGAVDPPDRRACASALAEFGARASRDERPALVLVYEGRDTQVGRKSGRAQRAMPLHNAEEETLIAIVAPPEPSALRAVTWMFGEQYVQFPAANFREAVSWIEERRQAALIPFFEALLDDARKGVGEVTQG